MSVTTTPTRPTPAATGHVHEGVRTDIQALRAIAVLLVLAYHLWPSGLTGGFIGVDVFFVISGFLITSHLLSRPPRGPGDVADFWARRVKRLIPASMLVLVVTLIASRLVAPETQWGTTALQIVFASVYGLNWLLAANSVDYLAAEAAASPVQHFWSLSVEEQFYFVWPILIAALVVSSARAGRSNVRVVVGLAGVVAASLAVSVVVTATSPASAYFITPTRAWEFAAGGLLAAVLAYADPGGGRDTQHLRLPARGRTVVAALGLLAIAITAVTYSSQTPFPGWRALLPTVGTLAVLAALPSVSTGPLGRALALRPVQRIGDLSYAIYLWHWPIIVLLPNLSGGELGLLDAAVVIAVSVVLAALTKRFVEDPVRRLRPSRRQVFAAMAGGIAFVLVLAGLQLLEVRQRAQADARALAAAVSSGDPCLGAGTLIRSECRTRTYDTIVPTPAQAPMDKAAAYEDVGGRDCWSSTPDFPVVRCTFGNPSGSTRVALIGNSHAGQWLPALQAIAETQGWQITTFLASRCAMVPTAQNFATAAHSQACRSWVDEVTEEASGGDFDLVVLTNRMSVTALGSRSPEQNRAAYQQGYEQLLRTWGADGTRVLALRDTPAPGDGAVDSMPDCVAGHRDDLQACAGPRDVWAAPDPVVPAARTVDGDRISVADLNDYICGPQRCDGVVGGVLVYSDGSHLTATYARTLAGVLQQRMTEAMSS